MLLTVADIRKHYGPEPVLNRVTFDVRAGERLALVGPNGAGKTTLLKILAGLEDADAGDVSLHGTTRLELLEQQPQFAPGRTVWDEAREALEDLIQLGKEAEQAAERMSAAVDEADRARWAHQFDLLQHELQQRDGYQLDHKIQRVLDGLGFDAATYQQPVETLSGGQQNRLLLARLLLQAPEVMVLDEPSNHLDIDATQWLEDYLATPSPQAVIVVSHDRYFLDRVATRTLELFQGTVDSYPGNYSAYCRQKAERLEVQRRTYEKQQTEIAKMEEFVRRHHSGQKHAQAEDRRRKLERIVPVDPPREIAAPPMGFPSAERSGDIVLRVERLAKAFDQPLFSNLTFDVLRGEKWGILGPNGSGKTTLLRCLLDRIPADDGQVVVGTGVRIAYFDQRIHCLSGEEQVVDAVRPDHKEFVEQQRRDLLARFGITGDMVFQRVDSLSGGERNRAALAQLSATDSNCLILDEPTNHLDLWARGALEKSLREFNGTVIFVSHDRYFLNQVADHLLVVQPDGFRVIDGNYDTYRHLVRAGLAGDERQARKPDAGDTNGKQPAPPKATRGRDNNKPAKRKRKFPYRKVADLEVDIQTAESRIEQLFSDLASPEVQRDGDRVRQTQAELEQQQQTLAELYEHWEEACELN